MTKNKEILLNQGEGKSYWVLGDRYTFKVTGKETGGALMVMDQIIQSQSGPPPHIHRREDESFFVREGTFSFQFGDRQSILEKGAFAYIPKGTLHTFQNIGPHQGKLLVMVSPAGLEEFFYSIGTPADGREGPPAFDPAVIDKILKLADAYEMEVLLPKKE